MNLPYFFIYAWIITLIIYAPEAGASRYYGVAAGLRGNRCKAQRAAYLKIGRASGRERV